MKLEFRRTTVPFGCRTTLFVGNDMICTVSQDTCCRISKQKLLSLFGHLETYQLDNNHLGLWLEEQKIVGGLLDAHAKWW
jgi:hypothetical protein